jgi:hypothetical protein
VERWLLLHVVHEERRREGVDVLEDLLEPDSDAEEWEEVEE